MHTGWLLAVCLAVLTSQRAWIWRSDESLWADAYLTAPQATRPLLYMAGVRMAQRQFDVAERMLTRAAQLAPLRHATERAQNVDNILANLAVIRVQQGRLTEAVAYVQHAPIGSSRHEICQWVPSCQP